MERGSAVTAESAHDLGRWDWAYLVECETCGWYNISQDYGWTRHSGVVHTELLKIGHVLKITEPERVERG